jgi:uncharacterized phiE125 gp8 family phage protein
MTTRLITPPAALAVDLDLAKKHLKIDPVDTATDAINDATVTAWIKGITGHAEHYMGRSLINQTWRVTLDKFPDAIKLYNPPLVSVASLKYLDENGVERTLDPADYKVDGVSEPGYIVPAPGTEWPNTDCAQVNAVYAEFICGYGTTHADVPDDIKLYIVAKLLEQYDPNASAAATVGKPYKVSYIDSMLDRYKVY